MAGHSLGEYAALVASGALQLRDGVPLVRFRAEVMQDAVGPGVGAMAAIMGGDDAAIVDACREAAQGEVVEPVNFNAPGQLVIAGHKGAVERAIVAAKARGAKRKAGVLAKRAYAKEKAGGAAAAALDRAESLKSARRDLFDAQPSLGEALHEICWQLANKGNLLGLAYTLYALAGLRVVRDAP